MISAAITPGIQPANVKRNTIKTEPQPLSITDNGGNKIASITLINDIMLKNTKKLLKKQFQHLLRPTTYLPNTYFLPL